MGGEESTEQNAVEAPVLDVLVYEQCVTLMQAIPQQSNEVLVLKLCQHLDLIVQLMQCLPGSS
jgi:hypothetical protein